MSKRVLIAIQRFKIGGSEAQALTLARYLKDIGYEVFFSGFGFEKGNGMDRFVESGIPLIQFEFSEKLILYSGFDLKSLFLKCKYLFFLFREIKSLKIDVIIPFNYSVNVIFCTWYKFMKVSICFWNQRDSGIDFKNNAQETQAIARSSFIISNSKQGKLFLQKITSRDIHVINNGIDVSKYYSVVNRNLSKIVVMIANIHDNKDHLTLLKAWRDVIKVRNDLKLVLAGYHGNQYLNCKEFVIDNLLEDSVIFLGTVNDIPKLLSTAALAVFSSKKEGFPNGILEPMASGLPIVATQMPGSIEVLGQEYPFLVPIGDSSNFASKILKLINSQDLSVKVGKGNKNRAIENFSIEVMASKFIQLI